MSQGTVELPVQEPQPRTRRMPAPHPLVPPAAQPRRGRLAPTAPRRPAHARRPAPAPAPPQRDVALDLIRGLAIVILLVNHVHLESPLEEATRAVLSAAEVLVMVSGVVVGIVFGRRWLEQGPRATTRLLLLRARKLYVASVVVVSLVALATLVPFLATDVLAFSPRVPDRDLYAFDGPLDVVVSLLTLEAGPWQFNILGLFIAVLALAPVVLATLSRRHGWALVVGASFALYLAGRAWDPELLPSQSERPFPLAVWQLLFVGGVVVGWHRERIRRAARWLIPVVLAAAVASVALRLSGPEAWEKAHLHKATLDPLRLMVMVSVTAALYLAFTRWREPAARWLGPALLPLGRNSFYVFIVHVFLCLAVATLLPGNGPGHLANVPVQLACIALLWWLVTRRVLFSVIPR